MWFKMKVRPYSIAAGISAGFAASAIWSTLHGAAPIIPTSQVFFSVLFGINAITTAIREEVGKVNHRLPTNGARSRNPKNCTLE